MPRSLQKQRDTGWCVGWWGRCDRTFGRLRAPVVTTISILLSSNKMQNGDILVLAYTRVVFENGR